MAMFGKIMDAALSDILPMVARKTGRFSLMDSFSGPFYELYVDNGDLTGLVIDRTQVENVFKVRSRLLEMMTIKYGDFEFVQMAPEALPTHYRISIDMLLLTTALAIDEVEAVRTYLPTAQTIFKTIPNQEAWLDGELLEFWELTCSLLHHAASAETIAQTTGTYIDHVLLCLYKLRAVGLVGPTQIFDQNQVETVRIPLSDIKRVSTAKIPHLSAVRKAALNPPNSAAA